MARNVYECLFILDSNRYARDANAVAATIPNMVQNLGGDVLANRLWNEQKLAYSIKGHRKGTYWLTYFWLDSDKLHDFQRACRLNDNVLRNMVLRVDPRLVDVLVSHALGKTTVAAQARTEEKPREAATAGRETKGDATPEGAHGKREAVTDQG